jgi:polyphosphate kinase
LKHRKLTDVDIMGLTKWEGHNNRARGHFLLHPFRRSPWTVVRANDKRRTTLNAMRFVLTRIDYTGKDFSVAAPPDPLIVGSGPEFFATR